MRSFLPQSDGGWIEGLVGKKMDGWIECLVCNSIEYVWVKTGTCGWMDGLSVWSGWIESLVGKSMDGWIECLVWMD